MAKKRVQLTRKERSEFADCLDRYEATLKNISDTTELLKPEYVLDELLRIENLRKKYNIKLLKKEINDVRECITKIY